MTLFFANVPNNCFKFCKKKREKKLITNFKQRPSTSIGNKNIFQKLAFFYETNERECSFCRNALHQSHIVRVNKSNF